jgi:hypothetical protein
MTYPNKNKKKNNNYHHPIAATAATISILAVIMVAASTTMTNVTPVAATTTSAVSAANNNATAATASTPSSSGIELSSQPVYQERVGTVNQSLVNQARTKLTISGNGTLTLPNSTEVINTTSKGSIIVSQDGTGVGKEVLRTKDRSENATATFYEIARFNMQSATGRGIIIALIHTNSTGKLAPLDGMILVGQQEFTPQPTSLVKVWEWHSGIAYLKMPMMTTTEGEPSSMKNTNNDTAPTTANELPPSSSSSSPLTGP